MEWLFAATGIAAIIVIWYILTANSLRKTAVKTDEALADIDVALAKRHDVLIKMLDISKSYARYEKDTILETIKFRSGMSIADRNNAIGEMEQANRFLFAVAENYPQLKSSENFRQLQISIMDTEEHLQAARRLYNSNISCLNQMIVSFPGSIVAKNLHMNQREFLAVEDEQRQDVKMEF